MESSCHRGGGCCGAWRRLIVNDRTRGNVSSLRRFLGGWFGFAAFQEFGIERVEDLAFLLVAAEEAVKNRATGL